MKRIHWIMLVAISFSCQSFKQAGGQKQKEILFIGNSLTYYNQMPTTLQTMFHQSGIKITVHQSTFPGLPLNGHLEDIIVEQTPNHISTRKKKAEEQTLTEQKLKERKWAAVILQTGTVQLLISEAREYVYQPSLLTFDSLIRQQGGQPIIYQTFASNRTYPQRYCHPSQSLVRRLPKDYQPAKDQYCSPLIESLAQETQLIQQAYTSVNQLIQAPIAKVGQAFYACRIQHPDYNLFSDQIHPSPLGSYLMACVFYKLLSGKQADSITYYGDITRQQAEDLQKIADQFE